MNSFIKSFQGPTDLRTPLCNSHLTSPGSSVVVLSEYREILDTLKNITKLLNTLCKRILYTHLRHFFFFWNTFVGESPFRFCDIFYAYFEINFKYYFVISFSLIGSRIIALEENCPPTLTLTLTLTQTLTLTGGAVFFGDSCLGTPPPLDFIAI